MWIFALLSVVFPVPIPLLAVASAFPALFRIFIVIVLFVGRSLPVRRSAAMIFIFVSRRVFSFAGAFAVSTVVPLRTTNVAARGRGISAVVVRVRFLVSSTAATRRIRPSITITVSVPIPVPVSVAISMAMRGRPVRLIVVVSSVSRGDSVVHLGWRGWRVVIISPLTGGASVSLEQFRRRCGFLVVWGVVKVLGGR